MIWIIGAGGMLGTEVKTFLSKQNGKIFTTDKEVSILEPEELRAFAVDKEINWIVNCSAYTAVDAAEDNRDLCFALNETGAGNIAIIAKEINAKLIHISTDYVFDGTSSIPLTEDAPTNPIGVYGESKLAGEQRIAETIQEHFIIRTAWLYGEHGNNFVHTMLKLMKEKDELGIIDDQIGSPTCAFDLTALISEIISQDSDLYGIYHYSNEGEISWYDFAQAIMEIGVERGLLEKEIPLNKLTTDQYPTKAKRPAYSLLDKTKVKKSFGIYVPQWRQSLNQFLSGKKDA